MPRLIEKLRAPDFSKSLKEKCLDDIALLIKKFDSNLELNEATRLLGTVISRLHSAGVLSYPDLRILNIDTLFLYFGEEIYNLIVTNKFAYMSCL